MTRTNRTISSAGGSGGHPDWDSPDAAEVSNSGYTATKNGWLVIKNTVSGIGVNAIWVKINDIMVFDGSQSGDWYGVKDGAAVVPVNKGDVVTFTTNVFIKFYPCK